MNITILSVDIKTTPTAKGSYQTADVAYKNNTYQGKVEGKKVMSFGATKKAFEILATASAGETYEVEVVKNDKGYNDWVSMAKATAGAPTAPTTASKTNPAPRSTYETPEERAQRQILIVRQSSLSSAVALLTTGAKAAPSVDSVLDVAKSFENYVFGVAPATAEATDFSDIPDFDIPEIK
jgi:hypothetical protein